MKTEADMVGQREVRTRQSWNTKEARGRGLENMVKEGKEESQLLKMPRGRMI